MRASEANMQHAATKVTNRKDRGSMVRQFALNIKLSTTSVLLKHFVVIYIIKLHEYIIHTGVPNEKQSPEKGNALGEA